MTLRDAAAEVIRDLGPTHYIKLAEEVLDRGLATSDSKTPAQSLYSSISAEINLKGSRSEFVRTGRGIIGLRALHAPRSEAEYKPTRSGQRIPDVVQPQEKRTLRDAAADLLKELGPTHYRQLTKEILKRGLATSDSQTPAVSLYSTISAEINQQGASSEFVSLGSGIFALRGQELPETESADASADSDESADDVDLAKVDGDKDLRVRVPHFPTYRVVRTMLRVLPGRAAKHITGLQANLSAIQGTAVGPVDWTDPSSWLSERLPDPQRDLASAIWTESEKSLNPRDIYGAWLLCQRYMLLDEASNGALRTSPLGREFLDREQGRVEGYIDEQEGVSKLLLLVAEQGPAHFDDLLPDWTDYLTRHSTFRQPASIRETLKLRLDNLVDRQLVSHKSALYSLAEAGLEVLRDSEQTSKSGTKEQSELLWHVQNQETTVRAAIQDAMPEVTAFAFEQLIKRLLDELGYRDVEVTQQSRDGGIDLLATTDMGITAIREVIHARRHKRKIQRKDLDALRGSLFRFNAVRGTIIATSSFSDDTQESAIARGSAPITLIDGEKLVDLLMQNGIGVRRRTVEVLTFDAAAFKDDDTET